jgi:hypothetical protein
MVSAPDKAASPSIPASKDTISAATKADTPARHGDPMTPDPQPDEPGQDEPEDDEPETEEA